MNENPDGILISAKKLDANRLNAQRSTGPRTEQGKIRSRRNALKHGISSVLLITESGEDCAEFYKWLGALRRDLVPVGMLEEMLVETIAVCGWRRKRALRCEAGLVRQQLAPQELTRKMTLADFDAIVSEERRRRQEGIEDQEGTEDQEGAEDQEAVKDHLSLPLGADLDRILRYEASIQRQMAYAINQLERLQRARKGEHVPAPVSLQVSRDE